MTALVDVVLWFAGKKPASTREAGVGRDCTDYRKKRLIP